MLPACRSCTCWASEIRSRLESFSREVDERAGRTDLPEHRAQEVLLPGDPVEVAARQAVALPDERERLLALDVADPRGQVDARERVLLRRVQAHVHAAERDADPVEAQQVDLQVVVDLEPGELADGGRGERDARALRLDLGVAVRLGLVVGLAVGRVDPVVAVTRDRHVRVAREGDEARP
jgi:hypothetical protein